MIHCQYGFPCHRNRERLEVIKVFLSDLKIQMPVPVAFVYFYIQSLIFCKRKTMKCEYFSHLLFSYKGGFLCNEA